jgi:hypothetical protein
MTMPGNIIPAAIFNLGGEMAFPVARILRQKLRFLVSGENVKPGNRKLTDISE